MYCMFSECNSLNYINITGVNMLNVKNYWKIFDGVSEYGTIVFNPSLIRTEIYNLFPKNWEFIEVDEK